MFPLLVITNEKLCTPQQALKNRLLNQSKRLSLNPDLQHITITIIVITKMILSLLEEYKKYIIEVIITK
jgi:hypothetical protein